MASEMIEKDLYGGKHHVVHNPNAKGPQPRYLVDDEVKKGVTTIIGEVLAKDLLGWALDSFEEALLATPVEVRGVDPRVYVIHTPETIKEAKGASARKRDSGGSTGTEVHAMVEKFLKGEDVEMEKPMENVDAYNAFTAFVKWFGEVKPKVLNVEEVVYSDQYEYAGTYDCMLEIEGKVYLCDLKTSNSSKKGPNGVYAENFIQLGAYALAHEEERKFDRGSKLPRIDGLMVISAKKDGKLDIVTNEDVGMGVRECSRLFKSVLRLFYNMRDISTKLGSK